MSEYTDETLTQDIKDLAQALLDDPVTGLIIRDAGTHRDFTDEEHDRVIKFCEETDFVQSKSNGPRRFVNRLLAQGVARRVAQGDFTSMDDPSAETLIEQYKFTQDQIVSHWGRRPISFENFHRALRIYLQTPDLRKLINDAENVLKQVGGDYHDDDYKEKWLLVTRSAAKILHRYGWITQPHLANVASLMLRNGIEADDKAAIIEIIKKYKLNATGKGPGAIDLGD